MTVGVRAVGKPLLAIAGFGHSFPDRRQEFIFPARLVHRNPGLWDKSPLGFKTSKFSRSWRHYSASVSITSGASTEIFSCMVVGSLGSAFSHWPPSSR